MSDRLRVSTSDGIYTVVQPMDGPTYPLRYGEPWPAYEGKLVSNLELALAYDLDETRTKLSTKDSEVARLVAENDRMREALEPFADFAKSNIEHDGWGGTRCKRERIYVWFGPSDFINARDAYGIPDPAGGMPVEQTSKGGEA